MTAMIASPNAHNRPLFSSKEMTNFYKKWLPEIFPQTIWSRFRKAKSYIRGCKYSGQCLHMILHENIPTLRLSETMTNVLIPTFDVKLHQPVIFSTLQAKENALKDPFLKDVCIGTSAAPTFLPPHYFKTHDQSSGRSRSFHLIDGGIAANNPMVNRIVLSSKYVEVHRFDRDISFKLSRAFTIPFQPMEDSIVTLLGLNWLLCNPSAPSSEVVSIFASMVMDLTWSTDITKLFVRTFVHLDLFSWEDLAAKLENYNIFNGSLVIGGFLDRAELLEDLASRSILISMVNALMGDAPYAFYDWLCLHKLIIGEPLFSSTLIQFNTILVLLTHAEVDPHGSPSFFHSPSDVVTSEESSLSP
ncbi:patatin-like protein 2 isoform X3 [Cryptomeria japonica]|nr:patatin-like protein 2 isoform X3 [Cryptomeria japonica]XP_057817108.1 patatin-like protein 2 isoform X3 [Cryptomeria japonica]